jgi:RNA polymerase sigma-70 factor (subfamily 1)
MDLKSSQSSASTSSQPSGVDDRERSPLIDEARRGSQGALGRIFEDCRSYLLLVSKQKVPRDIRQKVAASDLVQQTMAEACHDFGKFTGHSEIELRSWLRRILLNNLANAMRSFRNTGKRDVAREIPVYCGESKEGIFEQLIAQAPSPSGCAMAAEKQVILFHAMDRLPEHYSQIIRLRHLEYQSFAEIGSCMKLSADSARKLWERAVERLTDELRPCDGKS